METQRKFIRRPTNLALPVLSLILLFVVGIPAQSLVTSDGRLMNVTLSVEKPTIMIDEPTYLTVTFENYSDDDLCMVVGGDYRNRLGRPESYDVKVTNKDGKEVPRPGIEFSTGGLIGCRIIPAHGNKVKKLFLPNWAIFEDPGVYTITVSRSLVIKHEGKPVTPRLAANVSTILTVIPNDYAKTGELIESLGARMLAGAGKESLRAGRSLAQMRDKRSIRFFSDALDAYKNSVNGTEEHSLCRRSAYALGELNDESAIAALKSAIDSNNEDTRLDVVSGLRNSKHPEALSLVISMKDDDYWFVRLRVAQRLSKEKSEISLRILREMLKDKHKEVRNAAQKSLDVRRKK